MAVSDWSSTTLCTHADVAGVYEKVYDLTDETVLVSQQADVTSWISKAQEEIGRELDATLKQYYSNYVGEYTTTDDLKDRISNLTALKHACIAKTLELMFRNNVNMEGDFNHTRQKEWERQYTKEYNRAVAVLRFDQDDDDEISDTELAQGLGANRFTRV